MTTSTSTLKATRDALHQIAEHVLAAAQYRETGTIRLHVVAGGFETVRDVNGGRLGVVDGRLVVGDPVGGRNTGLSTVAAAAEFAGITPGLPAAAYRAATAFTPDADLSIHQDSVRLLGGWYELGDAALREFAERIGEGAQQPTLWPEHFDLGLTFDNVNYGASPGDGHFANPYLYVGPHSGPPRRDSFWNADFGAVRLNDQIPSVDSAVAFFEQGRARANGRELSGELRPGPAAP
ncbi:MAG TPA: hypothetical protein VGH43_11620 [Jatrophihabitans sp.]|jgi:hypothetical protein